MPTDPIEHMRRDLLAVAMRDLGYSLDVIDLAIERAAILQESGFGWNDANVAAVREVDAWLAARRASLRLTPAHAVAVPV